MRARGILLISAANVIGGLTYLAQKQAIEVFTPSMVTFLRNLVALLAMGLLIRARGGFRGRYDLRAWARLSIVGVIAFAAPLLLGNVGLIWSTAGNASILILLEPAAILVFSAILLGERIERPQVLGVALGIAGALCIVLEDPSDLGLLEGGLLLGNLLLLLHAVLWGLYSPIMKPLATTHPALELTFLSMLAGMLLLVPAAAADFPGYVEGPGLGAALLWVLGLGLVGSFLGTMFWNASLRDLRASTVAPFVLLQPLAGVAGDWLVRGEVPTPAAWAGATLIAGGLLCVIVPAQRRRRARRPLPAETP